MKRITLSLCTLALCACTGSQDPAPESAPEQEPDRTRSSGYEQSLERARQVETQVLDAAEEQRRKIEEQEGGG